MTLLKAFIPKWKSSLHIETGSKKKKQLDELVMRESTCEVDQPL